MRKWREELLTFNSNQTMTVTTTEPTVAQPASLLPIVSAPEKKPIIENNDKKRIAKAVELLLIAPCLKVPQAMRAARFTDSESSNRAIQMQVRRALARVKEYEENINASTVTAATPAALPAPALAPPPAQLQPAAAAHSSSSSETKTNTSKITQATTTKQ